jgi:hypothetical protein
MLNLHTESLLTWPGLRRVDEESQLLVRHTSRAIYKHQGHNEDKDRRDGDILSLS